MLSSISPIIEAHLLRYEFDFDRREHPSGEDGTALFVVTVEAMDPPVEVRHCGL